MAISMDAPTELSSAAYPRVYRTALGWRLSLLTVGGLGIGVALATGRLLVSFRLAGDGSPPRDLWLSLLALSLLGLYAIARALWFRAVLSVDRIELIQPWGPVTNSGDVSVPRELYPSINPGDTVCAYLKHGAFRIPWYEIARCESLSP